MKLTGHKTRSVFDRYDVVSESDLREAAQKLNVALKTGSGTNPGTPQQDTPENEAQSA